MENYRDVSVDSTETDSSDAELSDSEYSDNEDGNYDVSSAHQSSDDEDVADNNDDEQEDAVELDGLNNQSSDDEDEQEDAVEPDGLNDQATVGDALVSIHSLTPDEIRALEFASVNEAYEFYYRYGRCKGFAIRKSDVRKSRAKNSKIIVMRQFVCNRHGLRDKRHLCRVDRKRDHRRLTRTNCAARLRVHYSAKSGKYIVSIFHETHNHELTPSKHIHLHPVYRQINESDRAQINGLQSHGIRTCHIMGYMVAQKGGYSRVGFTKKDLYNYFDKKMRDAVKDGDVSAALDYLNVKSSTDPMQYAEYSVDAEGHMKALFWADGISRSDYFCFGDVLAFDATYNKNKYKYPLVVFSGCNHHLQTVIFGAAVVSDETTETYKWLLTTFLSCMKNKYPKGVITDGDLAMREAIKQIFPDATHRLCAWHLNKNAGEKVKHSEFLGAFKKAMYSNFTPEQFEQFWSEMVKEFGLESNTWVSKTYGNKSLWAAAYLREHFFGRIRTTSQCEAINAILRTYVRKKGCIYEFMHKYDQALVGYRNNELVADFKSNFTEPVLSSYLHSIESDAAKTYTAEVFFEVKEQIMKVAALIVKERLVLVDRLIYILTKFGEVDFARTVVYEVSGNILRCSCRLFESRGLPCSHIFYVMKEEQIDHIPDSLVLTRWTKNAKVGQLDFNGDGDSNLIEQARFGAYCAAFTTFCKEASTRKGVYGNIMNDIMKLQKKYCNPKETIVRTRNSNVLDPLTKNGKGAPPRKKPKKTDTKRTRRRKNCPQIPDATDEHDVETDEQDVATVSVSVNDSKTKRKPRCDVGSSRQKKCAQPPQSETGQSGNISTMQHMDVRSRQVAQIFGGQPMMPGVQPMYPMYGMPNGENSHPCYGLFQPMMGFRGRE